ncbi:hypothetical protein [Streptomyces europaeiscabiei]|uniref:hypothetical protein n=1 Tax=Streptomyces europaeiscabiei TaxID=146819 RepID=UPI0029A2598E|nr:hypothetical protein [Streptomyces europaeiscabiei]MDX3611260.1 hypothetical protein [Streptomyces europaeiscabiei]
MILLVLFVPAVMMAFLFAMDAFEELLFPRLTAAGDVSPLADGTQVRSPDNAMKISTPRELHGPVVSAGPPSRAVDDG